MGLFFFFPLGPFPAPLGPICYHLGGGSDSIKIIVALDGKRGLALFSQVMLNIGKCFANVKL